MTGIPLPEPGRKRRVRWAVTAVAVACIVVLGIAAALGYRTLTRERNAQERLDRGIERLERADRTVVAIDAVIQAPLTAALESSATEALETADGALGEIDVAIRLLESAVPDLRPPDSEVTSALVEAASARRDMLTIAMDLLETDISAARALSGAEQGWELMKEAERLSDRAVKHFNLHTKPGVQQSTTYTVQAEGAVRRARVAFSEAETAFPAADFERYVEYSGERLRLLGISKQVDSLWLAGKVEESNQRISAYNEQERKVISLARQLPSSPAVLVAEAYEEEAREVTALYAKGRERATKADARVDKMQRGSP